MVADDRHAVPLIILAQASVCLGVGALGWLWAGQTAAVSALLGGLAAVLPNAFLAARLIAPGAASAQALLRAAWVGEAGKLVLTVVAFIAIFALVRPISAPAVFAGFIAVQLVVFGALLFGNGALKEASRES